MRRLTAVMTMVALLWTGSNAYASADAASPFSDIRGNWAENTIKDMVARGVLDGFADGKFRPNDPVKVDQFIKMLILSYADLHQNKERSWNETFLSSLSEDNRMILKQDYRYFDFKPSTSGFWAKPFIDVASDLHFLNKSRYSDFQANMTRENVAEVLYYTLQETEFLEDEQFSEQAAKAYGDLTSATDRERKFIAESLVKGIMVGYDNGNFGVGKIVTRAEALSLLERLTNKSKRVPIKASPEKLQRQVPTQGGGSKIVAFPDKRMWDAYDVLVQIGKVRGLNQDMLETKLRLFKDQTEKDAVQSQTAGTAKATEEATLWLDPQYNTYGITMRLRSGTFARNQESVQTFANYLFGYNASTFYPLFNSVCTDTEAGKKVESKRVVIGGDTVDIQVDAANKTVVFSISKKLEA
ncbi:S-layer homology domain-containing protein [Cohnella faecalis]|nr:S-layer homology domain-containing protein [Cohnella faecalis]